MPLPFMRRMLAAMRAGSISDDAIASARRRSRAQGAESKQAKGRRKLTEEMTGTYQSKLNPQRRSCLSYCSGIELSLLGWQECIETQPEGRWAKPEPHQGWNTFNDSRLAVSGISSITSYAFLRPHPMGGR